MLWKMCLVPWKFAWSHESQKYYCFGKLNLTIRFGKENSQFTKNIRETQNWSYQKSFCMILSNFCFLCFLVWKSAFCYEKGAWCHENFLEVMKVKNTIVLVNWTWLTVLERKTPNSPKIYAKHKIGPTKNCFIWFWSTLAFCAFWYEKVLFVMKRVLDVMKICLKSWKSPKCYCFGKLNVTNRFGKENSQFTKIYAKHKIGPTKNYLHDFEQLLLFVLFGMKKCFMEAHRENTGNTQGKHREHTGNTQGTLREHTGKTQGTHRENTGKTHGAHREYAMNIGHKNTKIFIFSVIALC